MARTKTHSTKPTWQASTKKKANEIQKQGKSTKTAPNEHNFATSNLSAGSVFNNVMRSPDAAANFAANFAPTLQAIVQPKLEVGAADDKYEREADRVSRSVVRQINSPTPPPSNPADSSEGGDGTIQRDFLQRNFLQCHPIQAAAGLEGGSLDAGFEKELNRARGGGQPLPSGLQASMGQAMGADFSSVKIHTSTQSDNLNRSIQAKAFTTGKDIFFRQGTYQPASTSGQELIAHELTHVVQQNGAGVQRKTIGQAQPIQVNSALQGNVQRLISSDELGKIQPPRHSGKRTRKDMKISTSYPTLLDNMRLYEREIQEKIPADDAPSKELSTSIGWAAGVKGEAAKHLTSVSVLAKQKKDHYPLLPVLLEEIRYEREAWDKLWFRITDLAGNKSLETTYDEDDKRFVSQTYKEALDEWIFNKYGLKFHQAYYEKIAEIDKANQKTAEIEKESIDLEAITTDESTDVVEESEVAEFAEAEEKNEPFTKKAKRWGKKILSFGAGTLKGLGGLILWLIKKGLTMLGGPLLELFAKLGSDKAKAEEQGQSLSEKYWSDVKGYTGSEDFTWWMAALEGIDWIAAKVRDWAGWLSVISGLIGLIPGAQVMLGVCATAGAISVIAGVIKLGTGLIKNGADAIHKAVLGDPRWKKALTKLALEAGEDIFACLLAFTANAITAAEGGTTGIKNVEGNTLGQIETAGTAPSTIASGVDVSQAYSNQATYFSTNAVLGVDLAGIFADETEEEAPDAKAELEWGYNSVKSNAKKVFNPIAQISDFFETCIAAWKGVKAFFAGIWKALAAIAKFLKLKSLADLIASSLERGVTESEGFGSAFMGMQAMSGFIDPRVFAR